MTLTEVILEVFKGEDFTEADGEAVWALLANASLYPSFKLVTYDWQSYDLSGSFRYNAAQIAKAYNIKNPNLHSLDYMSFYCAYSNPIDIAKVEVKFTSKGYIIIPFIME